MDFKKELLDYFNKTEIPADLAPDKVSTFVKPMTAAKRTVETVREEKPKPKPESGAEKQRQKAEANGEEPEAQPAANEGEGGFEQNGCNATAFIKIVFYHKLSRSEFLNLLGNTGISNQAYREINENPSLTVRNLIDILEKTQLSSDDYKKLMIAASRIAQLKTEARERLKSEEPKINRENNGDNVSSSSAPSASVKPKLNLNELTSPKTQEVPPIASHDDNYVRTNEFKIHGEEKAGEGTQSASDSESVILSNENGTGEKEHPAEKNEKKKRRLLFGKDRDYYFDEDTDDCDDEDETECSEDCEDKPRSNKGKFAAAAIGAVILIGASFGLRYYYTGSVLPKIDEPVRPEENHNEEWIFDAIGTKPPAQLTDSSLRSPYTVGGIREEDPLKQVIATDKRLLYISDNSLYIFEQIGKQTDQLDVRNYPADIKLLGLAETDKGIAVVSAGEGEPYTFYKTVENFEETGEENSQPERVSDSVTRAETVIELLDKDCPEARANIVKYSLSGTFSKLFNEKSRLIVLTEENIPSNCTKEDYATFMPYILTSEGRKLCSSENSIICKNQQNSAFTAIFSLDFENGTDIACTAGNLVKASALNNSLLYLAAGERLISLSTKENLKEKGSVSFNGTFEDFSEIGIYPVSGGAEQRIRATFKEEDGACLAVLDGELAIVNEVKNLGNGEAPAATCFYNDQTYIVTESGICYGIDENNRPITESGVKITSSDIYPLSVNKDNPVGIKLTPMDENGKRTGIMVNTVKLDGTEGELSSMVINSKTLAKNALDEYLSSPAEKDISVIGSRPFTDTASGIAVIPVVYFDGVSEVELFLIFTVSPDGSISACGSVAQYDSYSKNIFALVKGEYVIAVTDSRIITAKAENGNVVGYYDITDNNGEYRR